MTTLVTAAQLAKLRRMVDEPLTTIYSDALLTEYIENYPTMDELGTNPYYYSHTGGAPTKTASATWYPTYDLNMAAAEIWDEKAAALAEKYDFSADGGNYSQSQAYEHAQAQAKFYRGKRGLGTIHLVKSPQEVGNGSDGSYIGNLPESDTDGNDFQYLEM